VHVPALVFGVPLRHTLLLENVGEVAVTWRFVAKPEEKLLSKPWLSVEPLYGLLPPGESVHVSLIFSVDEALARDVSLGRELAMSSLSPAGVAPPAAGAGAGAGARRAAADSAGGLLEDILVLRAERGRDFYVPVTAVVLPTCFGCSLAQLARRAEPMRALVAAAAVAPGAGGFAAALAADDSDAAASVFPGGASGDGDDAFSAASASASASALGSSDASRRGSALLSVPKEVWRLCDVLFSRGLMTRGIFSLPGDPSDLCLLRECLDTGDPFPPGIGMVSYAHCLVELLSALREPVVPCALFPAPADVLRGPAAVEAWCRETCAALPALHFNTLLYVVRFGREVLAQGAHNGAQLDSLAFVLSRCLMRKLPHDDAALHAAGGAAGEAADASAAAAAAASAAAFAAAGGGGGGGEGEDGDGDTEASLSLVGALVFADRGTRWEPTREQAEAMVRVTKFLLTSPAAAFGAP